MPLWRDLRWQLVGSESYAKRALKDIRYIVIHHSAVDVDNAALEIAEWHVLAPEAGLFWPGIGYHFVVHWDGSIDYVGDVATVRYNVAGRNREVLGICLPGNFMKRWPSRTQLDGTRRLVGALNVLLPWAEVGAHKELALPGHETSCPGATWEQWRAEVTT